MSKQKKLSLYQTSSDRLHLILPALLQKVIQLNLRVLILSSDIARMHMLDKSLWTFSSNAFIPHGTIDDPHPEKQPVLLTTTLHNSNNASVLCFDFVDYAACYQAIIDNQEMLQIYDAFLCIIALEQQCIQDKEKCIHTLKSIVGDNLICQHYIETKTGWEQEITSKKHVVTSKE